VGAQEDETSLIIEQALAIPKAYSLFTGYVFVIAEFVNL